MNAIYDRELRERDVRDRDVRDREGFRDQPLDYRDQRPLYRDAPASDREISLGTGTILGIFFALALTCAVFFGFGYSMGRKSAPSATVPTEASAQGGGLFSSFKPSAGKPITALAQQKKEAGAFALPQTSASDPGASTSVSAEMGSANQSADLESPRLVVKAQTTPSNAARPAAANAVLSGSPAMPATNANGTTMVQVAAVSHEEDADLLLSALKKRGYDVFIRHEAQDRLLHVQVGPFSSKKDADVMRQRLLSDGYNAILK